MFKVKISLLYFAVVVATTAGAYYCVDEGAKEYDRRLEDEAETAYKSFQSLKELEHKTLMEKAHLVANSEIRVSLGVLTAFRDQLLMIERDLAAVAEPHRDAFIREQPAYQKVFSEFANAMLRGLFEVKGRRAVEGFDSAEQFMASQVTRLQACIPEGVDNCYSEFTYCLVRTLSGKQLPGEGQCSQEGLPKALFEAAPDLWVVAQMREQRPFGLVNADVPWEVQQWRSKLIDEFAATLNVRERFRDGIVGPVRDIYHKEGKGVYVVSMAPIIFKRKLIGMAILGDKIDQELVLHEQSIIGSHVGYLWKGQLLKGTSGLPTDFMTPENMDKFKSPYLVLKVDSASAIGRSSSIPGYETSSDLRYVILIDKGDALGAFETMRVGIPIAGLVLFIVGFVLIQVFIRAFVREFERLDQGIHEVISGNHDYRFAFDYEEELPRSMSQSISIMVALLLGKPLVEEEDEAARERWEDLLPEEVPLDAEIEELAPSERAVLSLKSADELEQEPAESYHKRVFGEYIAARNRLRQPTDKVTYMKFIEKLVKNENALKDKFGCKAVRFNVAVKEGKVTLKPVRIG